MRMEQNQQKELDEATACLTDSSRKKTVKVTETDIIRTVSVMTGIPAGKMSASANARLAGLHDALSRRIIGQEEAVDRIVRAIIRNGAGLKDPSRPVGSFLFLGPTGVGKTHLAKMLAEPVPLVIRNAPTKLMQELNYGKGYQYAHNTAEKLTNMQCLPDSLVGTTYYVPTTQGLEARVKARLDEIKRWKKQHSEK